MVAPQPSVPFRCLVLLMSVGVLATTLLGILMAFKYTRAWIVWGCLWMGIVLPLAFSYGWPTVSRGNLFTQQRFDGSQEFGCLQGFRHGRVQLTIDIDLVDLGTYR